MADRKNEIQFIRINSWMSIRANMTPPKVGPSIEVVESINLLIELSLRRLSGLTRFGLEASNEILNILENTLKSMVVRYMADRLNPPLLLIIRRARNRNPLATSIPTIRFLFGILSATTPAIGLTRIIGRM